MWEDRRLSEAARQRMGQPFRMLINGEWCDSSSGRMIAVLNPATGEQIAAIPEGTGGDVDLAVEAAAEAFARKSWSGLAPGRRSAILWRAADLIDQRARELAELETLDNGKPLSAALSMDLPMAASVFRYWAGWCTKIAGTAPVVDLPGDFAAMTVKEPVGVVGLIVPWNFPLLNAAVKLGPALAAGCTVVLKPAEQASLTTLCLGEILLEAGVLPGAVNIVTGLGAVAGARIAEHPGIAKISFTGSTAVGKQLIAASQGNLKRLTLELGGKSPAIVLPDADLSRAIPAVANGIFRNAGQICAAASRLLVHRSLFDQTVEGVVQLARQHVLGDGLDPATTLGPVISEAQFRRVLGMIDTARLAGGDIVTGGRAADRPGYFIEPTVITGVPAKEGIAVDEVFGPVLVALPYDDAEEAIHLANATEYGLSASIWTRDIGQAHRLARAVQAGTITINTGMIAGPGLPFGGVKQSGWGREGGAEGLDAYLETKTVITSF